MLQRFLIGVFTLLSWIVLLTEKAARILWPIITLWIAYTGLALFGFISLLNDLDRYALILILIAASLVTLAKQSKGFKFPSWRQALRAAEKASGLAHRPFSSLRDKPAGHIDTQTLSLWQQTRGKLAANPLDLQIPAPRANLAQKDPFALRLAAVLLLFIGAAVAGPRAPDLLCEAFTPPMPVIASAAVKKSLDLWLVPPDYTKHPLRALKDADSGTAQTTPENTVLKIRSTDSAFVSMDGTRIKLSPDASGINSADLTLTKDTKIKTGLWPFFGNSFNINIIPDHAPEVTLHLAARGPRDALKVTYTAKDDYAIKTLRVDVTAADKKENLPAFSADLPLPAFDEKISSSVIDLTAHPLSGSVAKLTITAEDEAGHIVTTPEQTVLVPEKKFTNPSARILAFERRRLMSFDDGFTRHMSANTIAQVAETPASYSGKPIIFLGLVSATYRLMYGRDAQAAADTVPLLWDLALQIEDSGLGQAARELSEALKNLSRSLQNPNASEAEIQQILADIRQKMQQYAEALAADMRQKGIEAAQNNPLSQELAERLFKKIDMDTLMKRIAQLQQGDSREQMRKMAEMLRQSVENYDPAEAEKQRREAAEALQALNDLQKIIEAQQALQETTRRLDADSDMQEEKLQQNALKQELQKTTAQIQKIAPETPQTLQDAEQAMDEAEKNLAEKAQENAVMSQQKAIDALQSAMDKAMEKIAEQLQQGLEQSLLSSGFDVSPSDGPRDPLGRPINPKGDNVAIPAEQERRRVQDILQELQKRSGDYSKPETERDYLRRLLDMF